MNRVSRRTLLAAAAGGVMAGLAPGAARAQDTTSAQAAAARAAGEGWWSTPGYTAANSGFSQHETTILTSTVGRVTPKATLLAGSTGLSAPVLDKGRIFAADSTGVTALSESTGARLWRFDYDGSGTPVSTAKIVIRDGVLIAAWNEGWSAPPPSTGARIVTLDAVTGVVLASSGSIMDGGFDRMLVDRGVIALTVTDNRWTALTQVLRIDTLEPVWNSDYHYLAAPVSANGQVLMRAERTHSSEIRDLETGRLLWTAEGPEYSALAANEAGSRFYIAWGHSLQIVDAATGTSKWLASGVHPREITATPTRLYVAHGTGVSAFDAATDRPVFWSRTFSAAPLKPIIAGGVLYVTVPGDRVHVLNPVDGTTITAPALTGAAALPVITNGRIYLADGTRITTYGL